MKKIYLLIFLNLIFLKSFCAKLPNNLEKAIFPNFCFIASLSSITNISQATIYYHIYGLNASDPIDYTGTDYKLAVSTLDEYGFYPLIRSHYSSDCDAKLFCDALNNNNYYCMVLNQGHATIGIDAEISVNHHYTGCYVCYNCFETDYFYGGIQTTYEQYYITNADIWCKLN